MVSDRVVAAAAGACALWGGRAAVRASRRLRTGARFQAARSAVLGRPTAYRLHLHGTGLEFAPWERNFVAECVLRGWPESGINVSPDVKPRPGQGDDSVFRDSMFIGDEQPGKSGMRFDAGKSGWDLPQEAALSGPDADEPDPAAGDDDAEPFAERRAEGWFLLARCPDGHRTPAVLLPDGAPLTIHATLRAYCAECGREGAYIQAGRYFIVDGRLIREDVPAEGEIAG